MKTFACDFETYYDKVCSIKTLGTQGYFNHPDFDAYMVTVWGSDGTRFVGNPRDFDWNLFSGNRVLSHNASFDEGVFKHGVRKGWWPDVAFAEWLCTADMTAFLGMPRNLKGAAGVAFDIEVNKDVRDNMKGKRWESMDEDFKKSVSEYALKDAELCYRLWEELGARWPEREQKISMINRRISQRGIPIDWPSLQKNIETINAALFDAESKIPWIEEFTPLSRKAFNAQCRKQGITPPTSLAQNNAEATKWFDRHGKECEWARAVSDYRRINSFKKKLESFANGTLGDGRYYGGFLYFGASTGRFSGSGGNLNLQNLPRGEMFGVDFRNMIQTPEGKSLVVVDLSQIEVRTLCYLAGDTKALELIKNSEDIYHAFGVLLGLHDPANGQLKAYDPVLRHKVKSIVLGCFDADTKVLTSTGWKSIKDVLITDLLWDGVEWVRHSGVMYHGIRVTQTHHGVSATADHDVMTVDGWMDWSDLSGDAMQKAVEFYKAPNDVTCEPHPVVRAGSFDDSKDFVYGIRDAGPRNMFTIMTTAGPIIVSNCGYGMGGDRFAEFSGMEQADAVSAVGLYRRRMPKVVGLWNSYDEGIGFSVAAGQEFSVELASGRIMSYGRIKRMRDPKSGKFRFLGKIMRQGRMMDFSLWGGVVTENCIIHSAEVLTNDQGWVQLKDVGLDQLVWDGVEFVRHDGFVSKGEQPVIDVHGVLATRDHKFLCGDEWVPAEKVCNMSISDVSSPRYEERLHRNEVWDVHSHTADTTPKEQGRELPWSKDEMGDSMRVRENHITCVKRTGSHGHVRKGVRYTETKYSDAEINSRKDHPQTVCSVEINARPVPTAVTSVMAQLRRAWNNCVLSMGRVFPELLGRHVPVLEGRTITGSCGQLTGLLPRELPVGLSVRTGAQHKEIEDNSGYGSGSRGERNMLKDLVLSDKPQLECGGRYNDSTERVEKVGDLVNCGPRNRFAVRADKDSPVLIAHNCSQALARDIFSDMMVRVEEAGYNVIMHVHDELVVEVDTDKAELALQEIEGIMSTPPEWTPDIPLAAEGKIMTAYTK